MKKRLLRRALAGVLSFCLLAGSLPALDLNLSAQAADGATVDAFGISMYEFTQEEKAQAEQSTPYGVGYGTKAPLLQKNELFLSMGWNENTRITDNFDLNGEDGTGGSDGFSGQRNNPESIQGINGEINKGENYKAEPYRFVETASMDLNGTGKKEYIAHLGYKQSPSSLWLYITDAEYNMVTEPLCINEQHAFSTSTPPAPTWC